MNIKQLITFVTLAKEQNYIKTSELLNYAPSTLAKHIHALEEELNSPLVEYKNNKIELTDHGKRFLPYANQLLDIYHNIQNEFDSPKGQRCIRLAGGELMVGFSFGDFFADFEKKNPSISLQVNTICCARVPEWLDQNVVDIGFVQTLDTREDEHQTVLPLFKEKLCLMTSDDHPLVNQAKVRIEDMHHLDFSYTYEDCCFTDEFRNMMHRNDVHPRSELFLGSIHAVINTAKSDKRICLIPYVDVEKVKAMGLVQLNWVDAMDIYDVILLPKGLRVDGDIDHLIQRARAYTAELKRGAATQDIVLL